MGILGSESGASGGPEDMVGEMFDEAAGTRESVEDAENPDRITGVECVGGNGGVGGLEGGDSLLIDLQDAAWDEGDLWGTEGVRLGGELMGDLLEEATAG